MPFALTLRCLMLALLVMLSLPAHAKCSKIIANATGDTKGASPAFGRITLTNAHLQPPGTPLGSSVVNFTAANKPGYSDPDQVLWECDAADKDQLYEMISTNADDRVGGFFDLGAPDGFPNYYATYFPYVALKLTHMNSGLEFTPYWQQIKLEQYHLTVNARGKQVVQVRVKDLSPIRADLIRVSQLTPGGAGAAICGMYTPSKPYHGLADFPAANQDVAYTCHQPNGYVAFKGPGVSAPTAGRHHKQDISGWSPNHWNAIGMGNAPAATLSYADTTCVTRNVTPVVTLPTLSVNQLQHNETAQAPFNITIECDAGINVVPANASGSGPRQTALGLQVPYDSYQAAEQMGQVNGQGGVHYLLSQGYGKDPSVAKGVGIALYNPETGNRMPFLGWQRCTSGCGGPQAGWFPVLDGARFTHGEGQFSLYTIALLAQLEHIPGQQVTAGRVDAKAYVVVKVQ